LKRGFGRQAFTIKTLGCSQVGAWKYYPINRGFKPDSATSYRCDCLAPDQGEWERTPVGFLLEKLDLVDDPHWQIYILFAITPFCYHAFLLSHLFAITPFCYHTFLLSCLFAITPFCYHALLLSCLFAITPFCYHAFLLSHLFAITPFCYHAFLLSRIFAFTPFCYHTFLKVISNVQMLYSVKVL